MKFAVATYERPTLHDNDFDFLAPVLRRRGAEVEAPAWSKASVDWEEFDLVLVSSTWDYHTRTDEFRAWLRKVDRLTTLRNPRKTIEWNLDKRYLIQLGRAGVPTIPTIWTEPGNEDEIEATVAELGWSDVVIKPVVDLGAERLARVETTMVGRILRSLDEPAMTQPFLPAVERGGELSLIFIAGELSHALRKVPARGDFRVQSRYGASEERVEAPAEAVEIGRMALSEAPEVPLYGRVDLLADDQGDLRVLELELIEPNLYLAIHPPAADALAEAILALAG
ncbi:MAG: hypothetical protein WBB30_00170 [Solirubrobacterales bacterium]